MLYLEDSATGCNIHNSKVLVVTGSEGPDSSIIIIFGVVGGVLLLVSVLEPCHDSYDMGLPVHGSHRGREKDLGFAIHNTILGRPRVK